LTFDFVKDYVTANSGFEIFNKKDKYIFFLVPKLQFISFLSETSEAGSQINHTKMIKFTFFVKKGFLIKLPAPQSKSMIAGC
jgi:hypothetical protein